jgi:signal transduction histidine kinase
MTRRRWAIAALALLGLAWALGGESVSIRRGIAENHLLDLLTGLSLMGGGLVALDRRPGNRIGPLMYAAGVCWFCGNWSNLGGADLIGLMYVGTALGTPLVAHFILAYPTGRLTTGFERAAVATMYVVIVGIAVAFVLTFDPRAAGCPGCHSHLAVLPSRSAAGLSRTLSTWSAVVLVPLFLAVLVRRWRRASPAGRRELAPFWVTSAILATVYLLGVFADERETEGFAYLLWELRAVLQICLPMVFVAGLLSARLARGKVGRLIVDLAAPGTPRDLRGLIAHALADPSVRILRPGDGVAGGPDGASWPDGGGPASGGPDGGGPASGVPGGPGPGGAAQRVTVVERDGRPLAALLHDPALDAELVQAVAAAAGMSIENDRLHAEVRAQLEEVRASRARIVAAGDEQRRRIERDLHDGAQQRLLTLALALRTARRQAAAGQGDAVAATLERADEQLRQALAELRELARGIHPAILTDAGLGPALRSLADRAGGDVRVRGVPERRFPATVEATAYFVVSEALANVARHAPGAAATISVADRSGTLTVEVADDGPGGADPGCGSGLRGLGDRVAGAGGRLTVDSPPGRGTRVRAELPREPGGTP